MKPMTHAELAGVARDLRPPRLFHLPNEAQLGFQVGPREAFTAMLAGGELTAYEAFSFLHEAQRDGVPACLDAMLQRVAAFAPDLIVWQHVGSFPVDAALLQRLRAVAGAALLVYHEGDVYGRRVKPLPTPVRALAAEADVVSLVGLGELAELFRAHGARRIVYSPHSFDSQRSDRPWSLQTTPRSLDALMIGNRVTSRLPWRSLPGARERRDLAVALQRRLGARFAVYGANWGQLPCARGPLPFDRQEAAIRDAWVTVSWDHFDQVPYYFSDRVPIALAAGVVHVTNRQPGYEQIFPADCGLLHASGVEAVADTVCELLSRPREELVRLGARGRNFARERLSALRVYRDLVRCVTAIGADRPVAPAR